MADSASRTVGSRPRANFRSLPGRITTSLLCLGLASAAIVWYYQDRSLRVPAARFSESFHLAQRRPAHAETLRLAPAADLGYEIAGDVAVQDALGSVRVAELDQETRDLWLQDIGRVEEELQAAELLLLDGVARRPGWAYHRSLLGMIDYIRTEGSEGTRWLTVLNAARAASPGDLALTRFAAAAVVDTWTQLSDEERKGSGQIFREALREPAFVTRHLASLIGLLGSERASALLPDEAPSLGAAVEVHAAAGSAMSTAPLYSRWERAEWLARQAELRTIQQNAAFGDLTRIWYACHEWVNRHPIHSFDHPEGRAQVAEILRMWPARPGRWNLDPRAELIRFFMNGRLTDVRPQVLENAASALNGVPAPVSARIALAAGDVYSAEGLANSSQASGSLEWTPFFVDLARYHLERGEIPAAEVVTERIAPAARDECDVAVLRRMVAEAAGLPADVGPGTFPQVYPAAFWASGGVPICVDPGENYRDIVVDVEVRGEPALLGVGFDGGRARTHLLGRGARRLRLPLEGRSGRHFFTFEAIAGGTVAPRLASLE